MPSLFQAKRAHLICSNIMDSRLLTFLATLLHMCYISLVFSLKMCGSVLDKLQLS